MIEPPRIHVGGTWRRQTAPALSSPLLLRKPVGQGRWHTEGGEGAVYLAEDEQTVWAEWYRGLAEDGLPPLSWVPSKLWSLAVDLEEIADLRSSAERRRLGLPNLEPDAATWPPFQQEGERLRAAGYPGLLAPSAALPSGLVLCVFAPLGGGVAVEGDPELHTAPPPPPRGMRT